ncbi:MAG: HAD-IC family P-type ATPase [Coriobacteriia bacterium]
MGQILRTNILTWFNLILGVLWVLMLTSGSWQDALFGMVLIVNTAIGTAQELHAKATLDRLALISAPGARVVRDGLVAEIGVGDVVLDEVIALAAGDQLVADAVVLDSLGLEIDESALTGESVPVSKDAGDPVMSGSFVVAGSGLCRATAVGADSYAMRLEASGRAYTRVRSEVMDGINQILRWIGAAIVPVGALTIIAGSRGVTDLSVRITNTVAALVSMVPEGLVLLSSVAFALSALALSRHRVLVNELPAVEGLARVDLVLTDKTGTLTEREPSFARIEMLRAEEDRAGVLAALGALASVDPAPNPTLRAIAASVPAPEGWPPIGLAPFSSARKWSAADFGPRGVWVVGAPDVILDGTGGTRFARERANTLSAEGWRVLVLARTATPLDPPRLPGLLVPIALVLIEECLRPDAADTIAYLREQGVTVKIISGDNPLTVGRIASAAGVPGAAEPLDAREFADPEAIRESMERASVFGRVMPEQKSGMVSALQAGGHVVSMTGDGVNDTMALKQADLGIAMGSGVPAARAVAQVVLLDDSFATLPVMMAEGRRVIANAERVANLFLTKSVWAMVLAVVIAVLGAQYPFLPRHITLVGSLCIGIPGFFLALGPNTRRYRPGFVPRVLRFALPSGLVIAAAVLTTFLGARALGVGIDHARTLSTVLLLITGLAVLAVLEWPLVGWRLAVVGAMAAGGVLAFVLPLTRSFFALSTLEAPELLAVLAVAGVASATIAVLTGRGRVGR